MTIMKEVLMWTLGVVIALSLCAVAWNYNWTSAEWWTDRGQVEKIVAEMVQKNALNPQFRKTGANDRP